jgi:alkylation response protein AidB-like acyl-CoA dehydrogenase
MNDVMRTENPWVARAERVALQVLASHADDVDRQGRWPRESVTALAEAGLLSSTAQWSSSCNATGFLYPIPGQLLSSCTSLAYPE